MRLILAAFAILFLTSATAAPVDPPLCKGCPTAAELKRLNDFLQPVTQPAKVSPPAAAEPAPVPPAPVVEPPPPPPPSPVVAPATPTSPVTQNVVTTSGPVSSQTTISLGTLAGQVLTWAAAAFGSVAATVFTAWGVRLFKLAGVQMTDAARERLQAIILNGLNAGAEQVSHDVAGKGQVEIKDAIVASAVQYAQAHGADTIRQLGLDPKSGAAVEVLKARVATLVADPAVATPAVLDPAKPAVV